METKERIKCTNCNSYPTIVKHCPNGDGRVYYNAQCNCKKTPLVRGGGAEYEWEKKYFNMDPTLVNKESGADKGMLYT